MKRVGIYIVTVLAAIIVFVSAIFIAEDRAVKNQEDVFNNHQALITSITARALADQLNAIYDRSRTLATSEIPLLMTSGADREAIAQKLSLGRDAIVGLMGHIMIGADKKIVAQRTYELLGLENQKQIWQGWLNACWDAFLNGKKGSEVPPVTSTANSQLMGILHPVRQGGEFMGVLVTLVDFSMLNTRYIQPMRSGQYGAGYMVDDQGVIIYDHEQEIIGRSIFDGMHDGYPDLLRVDKRMLNELSGEDTYSFTVHRKGAVKRKLVAWSTARLADRKFIIALSAPDFELSGAQQNMQYQAMVFATLLVVIVVVSSWLFLRLRTRIFEENERRLERLIGDRTLDLARSQERFRDMAEASSDWYWEMDENFCYTFISSRITEITGIDPQKFIGKKREDLANTPEDQETWQHYKAILQQHQAYRDFCFRVSLEDGSTRYFSSSGKPVFDSDGLFKGYRGTGSDVTKQMEAENILNENYIHLEKMVDEKTRDLKKATEEAERANAAKSDFLAKMSHELRTPLNAIIGFSEMLMEEADDIPEDEVDEALMRINRAGEHLLELVNDILDLSKVEAGKIELCYEEIYLEPFLEDLVKTSRLLADRNGSGMRLELEGDVGSMQVDRIKLKQVLFNLLSNACKFTQDGEIVLSAKRLQRSEQAGGLQRDCITFVVGDSGIGMTATQMENLFQEFYQIKTERVPEFTGTGLGLAISRKLVDMMGGTLDVQSTYGEGTVCTIILPADGVLATAAETMPDSEGADFVI